MGLTGNALNRFRARVDSTLADFFPVTLVISAQNVTAMGPGGRVTTQYLEGGESVDFRFAFRIPKTTAPAGWTPAVGASIDWKVSASKTIAMEIAEYSERPHEDHHAIVCRNRRKP